MIGKILRTMRKKSNLKQEDLTKLINFANTTISQYETGTRQPEFDTIEKIANACGYEIIFKNKTTNDILTSSNIDREEI